MTPRRLLIGLGNPDRGDDGVGPYVARRVATAVPPDVTAITETGDPLALLDRWTDTDEVVLIDAAAPRGQAGRIHRLDPLAAPLPPDLAFASTHTVGLAAALDLARVLGRLPARLVIYAIEAADFSPGAPLSPQVAAAADRLVPRLRAEFTRSASAMSGDAAPV